MDDGMLKGKYPPGDDHYPDDHIKHNHHSDDDQDNEPPPDSSQYTSEGEEFHLQDYESYKDSNADPQ
jgi:hypothetical protein